MTNQLDANDLADQAYADLMRSEQRSFPEWKDIDSAPKDGTPVLVFCRASREPFQEDPDECHVAYFVVGIREDWWDVSGGYMSVHPTHWMELPVPPL